MYNLVYFEVSGVCNAHCPWCVQGRGSLKGFPARFIPPDDFRKAVERLFSQSLIAEKTIIGLYNYGEPLLHPALRELLRILEENHLRFIISSNASVGPAVLQKDLNNLLKLYVSMPGFSQKSYDRVHGFSFEKVLKNIGAWAELAGPSRLQVQYHVYQFNLDEIEPASRYFLDRGIKFFPYPAQMTEYRLARSYLDGSMPADLVHRASRELLLSYLDDYRTSMPVEYVCPQRSILAIDEFCTVLTCCLLSKADPGYPVGSLFQLTRQQIEEGKAGQPECTACLSSGTAYWIHTKFRPAFIRKYEH